MNRKPGKKGNAGKDVARQRNVPDSKDKITLRNVVF